ncbi:hypothetical protein ACFOY2_04905 [Nonomuraea purpurea]|uniref:Uncharacterized protein n=1 Tax=Nonomuraea purpurea TaxID=1849276 RepID=A0ABV8G1W0_9ACTN
MADNPLTASETAVLAAIETAGLRVTSDTLPEIVAGLYRAVGVEPPMLLARPAWWKSANPIREWTDSNALTFTRRYDRIRVFTRTGDGLSSADALGAAAVLAAMALEAADEPSAEAVEEVAEVIYQSGAIDDSVSAAGSAETIARALLKAGMALPPS